MIRHNGRSPGQASPRQRLTAAQRRRLVLDAATRVFAEHGYQGAATAQIARDAGVVASVIYDHFGSKRELYLELLTHHGQALIEHTTRRCPSGSPEQLFTANVEAFYRFVETHPFAWRMIFRDPPADAEITAVHQDIQRRASDAITALIRSVRPDEQLIDGVPRAQADMILAEGIKAVNNGLAAWWYEHRNLSRDQVLAVARVLLWTGLRHLANPLVPPPPPRLAGNAAAPPASASHRRRIGHVVIIRGASYGLPLSAVSASVRSVVPCLRLGERQPAHMAGRCGSSGGTRRDRGLRGMIPGPAVSESGRPAPVERGEAGAGRPGSGAVPVSESLTFGVGLG